MLPQGRQGARCRGGGSIPGCFCADDSGVFGTSLSEEYAIAAASFGLGEEQLKELAAAAADYTFLPPADKARLKQRILTG